MRTLRSLSVFAALLVAFCPAAVEASGQSSDDKPAVEVVGHRWKPYVYQPWLETSNWYVEPGGNNVKGFQYKVAVRNGTGRTIRAIEWEYTFLDAGGRLVYRHRFVSPTKIKPGKVKELTIFSVRPPTDSVSAADAGSKLVEHVAIRAVTFGDDTRLVFIPDATDAK